MKYVLLFCGSAEDAAAFEALSPDQLRARYAQVGAWFAEHRSTVARRRAVDVLRRDVRYRQKLARVAWPVEPPGRAGRRGRTAAPGVHLLPPGAAAGGAGGADPADRLRAQHRRDRQRLRGVRGGDRAAAHPGPTQDRGGGHPLPGARLPTSSPTGSATSWR